MEMKFCQSCGMPLSDEVFGTEANGAKNEEYCIYCYKDGGFTPETLPASPLHWIGCAAMLALGVAIAYGFFLLAKRKNARNK